MEETCQRVERHELAAILNDIGNFDVSDFEGRLTLQKTVYLLQSFGINLGYKFTWYLHGAYCTALARDGFAIESIAPGMPKIDINFEADAAQRRYAEFKEFLRDKKLDPALLEISSSICHMGSIGMEKGEILRRVECKKPRFSAEQCERAWDDLEVYRVVGNGTDGERAAGQRVDYDAERFTAHMEEGPELPEPAQKFRRSQDGRARGDSLQPAGIVRQAPDAKASARRCGQGRRARIINAALGSAIFAAMSIGALAILGPPYGYIFAAGTAALAVLLPIRELRGNV